MATVVTTENNIVLYVTEDSPIIDEEKKIVYFEEDQIRIPKEIATNIYEIESIPEEVKPIQYTYIDGVFSIDSEYRQYYSLEEKISALEDVVNSLLGF